MSEPGPRDLERLERLLGGAARAAFRARLRRRYAHGRSAELLTLARLTAHERETLTDLLGRRPREASSLRVHLAELDDALSRAGLAGSLRHALELLDGPIPDLVAERRAREQAWAAVFSEPRDARLAALVGQAAGRSLIKRLAASKPDSARGLLLSAAHVLARLPAQGLPRSQLAADALGDAHALDTGRPVSTLVLSAQRQLHFPKQRQLYFPIRLMFLQGFLR